MQNLTSRWEYLIERQHYFDKRIVNWNNGKDCKTLFKKWSTAKDIDLVSLAYRPSEVAVEESLDVMLLLALALREKLREVEKIWTVRDTLKSKTSMIPKEKRKCCPCEGPVVGKHIDAKMIKCLEIILISVKKSRKRVWS